MVMFAIDTHCLAGVSSLWLVAGPRAIHHDYVVVGR